MMIPESTQECIKIFEEAIEKCKNGEILECLLITKNIDETMSFRCSETYNLYAFIGFLEHYKFDMFAKKDTCENSDRH